MWTPNGKKLAVGTKVEVLMTRGTKRGGKWRTCESLVHVVGQSAMQTFLVPRGWIRSEAK